MKNKIYINVAVMGIVNYVLEVLLKQIDDSGLYDNCDSINLVINGDPKLLTVNLNRDKYVIINQNSDVSKCEFPTLDKIWEDSQIDEFNLLYLHTKGVSRPHQFIIDWTNYMSYFNIDRWNDRISDLLENDCTGVNLFGNPEDYNCHPGTWGYGKTPKHYGGNFWWSKSSHIKKLEKPSNLAPDNNFLRWRMICEMWLCSPLEGKYHCAFSSNVDHYQQGYPKNLYEIK